MKKQFFSIVMMIALVIVAGTAMANNEKNVLPGGTYTYTLQGVYSDNAATATVTYLTGTGVTITPIGTSYTIPARTTSTVSFTVKYGTQASPATTGKISVVIADVANCSNSIELNITVLPTPIYSLNLTKDVSTYSDCQARTGVSDNAPDALGTGSGELNTFTYTVTPIVTNVTGNFTYSYTISLPDNATLRSFNNGSGALLTAYNAGVVTHTGVSAVAPDVFTVTFNTTTGAAAQTLAAALTVGASSLLVPVDGGGTYQAIMTSGGSLTQSVPVKAVPTIGTFN